MKSKIRVGNWSNKPPKTCQRKTEQVQIWWNKPHYSQQKSIRWCNQEQVTLGLTFCQISVCLVIFAVAQIRDSLTNDPQHVPLSDSHRDASVLPQVRSIIISGKQIHLFPRWEFPFQTSWYVKTFSFWPLR